MDAIKNADKSQMLKKASAPAAKAASENREALSSKLQDRRRAIRGESDSEESEPEPAKAKPKVAPKVGKAPPPPPKNKFAAKAAKPPSSDDDW